MGESERVEIDRYRAIVSEQQHVPTEDPLLSHTLRCTTFNGQTMTRVQLQLQGASIFKPGQSADSWFHP